MRCVKCGMASSNSVHWRKDQFNFHAYEEPKREPDPIEEIRDAIYRLAADPDLVVVLEHMLDEIAKR